MTDKDYFSHPAIDQTLLKVMLRSPAHFRWARENRDTKATPAMLLGRAVHAAALQPRIFKRDYLQAPDRRTNAGKAAAAEAEAAGKVLLSAADYEQAASMGAAIREQAGELLRGTKKEKPIFWTDKQTGLHLKAKLDAVSAESILDLKTAGSADADAFSREAFRLGYHIQAGFYQMAVEERTGRRVPFIFIVAEKEPPYLVRVLRASDDFIDAGRWAARELLDKVAECEKSGEWPGYEAGTLELPAWAEV